MSEYFFDSSALFKRYQPEVGTAWVKAATAASQLNKVLVAQITPVEMMSAGARLLREGKLSARTLEATRLYIQRHVRREYVIVLLSDEITNLAQRLIQQYPLRAADAIQLASAIVVNRSLVAGGLAPLTFVSSDTRLLNAAAQTGMPTHEPK